MKLLTLIKQHPVLCSVVAFILVTLTASAIWGKYRPLPAGLSFKSDWTEVRDLRFLKDLTYRTDGVQTVQQEIFPEVFRLIDEAERFLIMDMFLFNAEYDRRFAFPPLSSELADKLIRRKKQSPELRIHVITDPINTFYGAYENDILSRLKLANIEVTETRLEKLRHSNPLFSTIYGPFLSHFGTKGNGWIPNPFSPDSPRVTLRAVLKMLNFRANHRKVIVSEKEAIVSSANPHDASGYHSNIAFAVKGPIVGIIAEAECAVIRFSDGSDVVFEQVSGDAGPATESTQVKWITEGRIREQGIEILDLAQKDDEIDLAMFYLSDRGIIKAIHRAAHRGVSIRLVLDSNKDAFGRKKNGIPNRQVAAELIDAAYPDLSIRWYYTEGEQFHSKLLMATLNSRQAYYVMGGSANLTKRNIGDYNLEANLCVRTGIQSPLQSEISNYFNRIWRNESGFFTEDYSAYSDDSWFKYWIYRVQEFTGACTF